MNIRLAYCQRKQTLARVNPSTSFNPTKEDEENISRYLELPKSILDKLAIKAMMDSGYKNAAYALAELMDNSIEAGAKSVELLCLERYVSLNQKTVKRIDQIGILDNGNGMDLDTLRIALRFGDGTRLD